MDQVPSQVRIESHSRRGRPRTIALWLLLAYLGPLCLIPLAFHRKDQVVLWHSKHGLVLLIADCAALVASGLVGVLLVFVTGGPTLPIFLLLWTMLLLALLTLHGLLAVKAVDGERLLIPGVSHYADRF